MNDVLTEQYDLMWQGAIKHFTQGSFEVDSQIQSVNDQRKGITIIAKMSEVVANGVQHVLRDLKEIEPDQYYYSNNELHLTVLSIISCDETFCLNDIVVEQYISVIEKAVTNIKPFDIKLEGITASPSCVLLQGFPLSDELLTLRNSLREAFKGSNLQNSIDKRYKINTAHSTIARFQKNVTKPQKFTDALVSHRATEFKQLHVKELHLVYNDWYHKEDRTTVLSKVLL